MLFVRRLPRARRCCCWLTPLRADPHAPMREFLRTEVVDMVRDPYSPCHDSFVAETETHLGLREDGKTFQVNLAAPGIKPEDMSITIDGHGVLRIKGGSPHAHPTARVAAAQPRAAKHAA